MAANGPIILIEDDADDVHIFEQIMKDIKVENEVVTFITCNAAMDYLVTTKQKPFLIVCDINLPEQNGLDFKKQVDENPYLRRKSIPFIFYSTSTNIHDVNKAYTEMSTQGFFAKCADFEEGRELWKTIIAYWKKCCHPNT